MAIVFMDFVWPEIRSFLGFFKHKPGMHRGNDVNGRRKLPDNDAGWRSS